MLSAFAGRAPRAIVTGMPDTPRPTPFFEPVSTDAIEEARAFNSKLEALLSTQPSVHTIPVAITRRVRRAGGGVFPPPVFLPRARDLTVPSRGGDLRLRVIAPEGRPARGAYLHVHGGGWTLGAADLQDVALAELADATGLTAVSVDYRLAPEHPHPAGADDAEDAARWLLADGASELGVPARFTIGGESAGAHLAVLTLLRLRDGAARPALSFDAANLVFGAFDLGMTPSTVRWGERNLILSLPIMRFFGDGLLPGIDVSARRSPELSPLYADLRNLPRALFTVGTVDPLLDDSLFMAARWRAAGNDADLRVWPEGIHGFTAYPLAIARAADRVQHAFLSAAVA
jgi:acetyl esterase/lipase